MEYDRIKKLKWGLSYGRINKLTWSLSWLIIGIGQNIQNIGGFWGGGAHHPNIFLAPVNQFQHPIISQQPP